MCVVRAWRHGLENLEDFLQMCSAVAKAASELVFQFVDVEEGWEQIRFCSGLN